MKTFLTPPQTLAHGKVKLHFVQVLTADDSRGFVPAYHFRILIADGSDAGHMNFRVGDTEHIRMYAGHIGFKVHEPFRGNRYAYEACLAIGPFVRLVYETVIITCDPDNYASIHTIERLGASFLEEIAVPANEPQFQRGSRSKRRYEWRP